MTIMIKKRAALAAPSKDAEMTTTHASRRFTSVRVAHSSFSSSLSLVLDHFPFSATHAAQRLNTLQDGPGKTFSGFQFGPASLSISSLDGFGKSFSAGTHIDVAQEEPTVAQRTVAER